MDSMIDFSAGVLGLSFKFLLEIGGTAANIMSESGTTVFGQISSKIGSLVTQYMTLFQSIGYGITILFFLFNLLNLITSEQLTLEQFIKKFCLLFVGIAIVGLSPTFYEKISEFGNAFTSMIMQKNFDIASSNSDMAINQLLIQALETVLKDSDMNDIAAIVFALLICIVSIALGLSLALISLIIVGIVYVIGFSWIIEKNIRGLFLPIGLSLFSDDGWRGAGGRYFRKFLAICCQGAVIAMIGKLTNGCIAIAYTNSFTKSTLAGSTFLGFLTNLLKSEVVVLGVAVAAIAAMFKAQQIINDTFGV